MIWGDISHEKKKQEKKIPYEEKPIVRVVVPIFLKQILVGTEDVTTRYKDVEGKVVLEIEGVAERYEIYSKEGWGGDKHDKK